MIFLSLSSVLFSENSHVHHWRLGNVVLLYLQKNTSGKKQLYFALLIATIILMTYSGENLF